MDDIAPLIVTALFEDEAQRFFEAKRQQYFPPERNFIPAHLTLFHKLPGADLSDITTVLREATRDTPMPPCDVTGLRFLGFGSCYEIESAELSAVRAGLVSEWDSVLSDQDRRPFNPHVTFQNKADPDIAKAVFALERDRFEPFVTHAVALRLWHYRGGPWDEAGTFPFADQALG